MLLLCDDPIPVQAAQDSRPVLACDLNKVEAWKGSHQAANGPEQVLDFVWLFSAQQPKDSLLQDVRKKEEAGDGVVRIAPKEKSESGWSRDVAQAAGS